MQELQRGTPRCTAAHHVAPQRTTLHRSARLWRIALRWRRALRRTRRTASAARCTRPTRSPPTGCVRAHTRTHTRAHTPRTPTRAHTRTCAHTHMLHLLDSAYLSNGTLPLQQVRQRHIAALPWGAMCTRARTHTRACAHALGAVLLVQITSKVDFADGVCTDACTRVCRCSDVRAWTRCGCQRSFTKPFSRGAASKRQRHTRAHTRTQRVHAQARAHAVGFTAP
jgi:hypothetical protein